MKLDELPADLICRLPHYLDSLDDLYSLICTSRAFHRWCYNTEVQLRPPYSQRARKHLFPPHPHLLIGSSARSIAEWATEDHENEDELRYALLKGIEGLYDLCTIVVRMSINDARNLIRMKHDFFGPLIQTFEACLEPTDAERIAYLQRFGSARGFPFSTVPLVEYPELSLLTYWIYCELFHHTIDACFSTVPVAKQLSHRTRLLFLHSCAPDIRNRSFPAHDHLLSQLHRCSRSPWPFVERKHFRNQYMSGLKLLMVDHFSPLSPWTIERLLKETVQTWETAAEPAMQIPLETLATLRHRLYNVVQHKPCLVLPLILGDLSVLPEIKKLWESIVSPGALQLPPPVQRDPARFSLDDQLMEALFPYWTWVSIYDDCSRIMHGPH